MWSQPLVECGIEHCASEEVAKSNPKLVRMFYYWKIPGRDFSGQSQIFIESREKLQVLVDFWNTQPRANGMKYFMEPQ